ncbi:hypothetical protein CC1G_04556 [Coprinopsis cinerea okayama7|uniref:Succinate dehydrogenase assembly factor 4, mitochondrial n=1 Tax=Coprinopsis cinerea (strain Okayama-7 / 130 / ATCC MYA-4618 / FGSC 9003) TaxID=240176 RepID=A8N5H8_COPC7|nr:hypothetical protein CC1G_04556 [Coprinopsis cinerea okayama7\|eukprot:XP_001830123.1 hypothetical protein CC1G_04556 [Coprinopsis cinerea okayama7\
MLRSALASTRARARTLAPIQRRTYADLNRPRPPPLPAAQQREFEELQRKAQTSSEPSHPDAPTPVQPEFEGEVNPTTGERGGPKREPVGKWTEDGGDWSFKGRVSDF